MIRSIIMILKYILFATLSVVADFLAFTLAPIAALFYYKEDPVPEHNGVEMLYFPFNYLTTHDSHVDTYLIHDYWENGWLFTKVLTNHKSAFTRYCGRIAWIWRNPAYKFDHMLGYKQDGVEITTHYDSSEYWDTGRPSRRYQTAVNIKQQKAFLWERQIYYYKNWCIELQFGWKLYRNDPDGVCMLAFRISPFKRY